MNIIQNIDYQLEVFIIDKNGEPISGLTVTYEIFNSNTDSLIDSGTLTDLSGGVYKGSFIFNTLGQFRILYHTPTNFEDKIETIFVKEQFATEELLIRVLGLSQENYRLFDLVYDDSNNLTSATIKIYGSKSDTDNNVNPIETYIMTATYTNNLMNSYKVTKN